MIFKKPQLQKLRKAPLFLNKFPKEKSEQQPVPEQISQVGNEKSEQHDQSWTGKENKRREKPQSSKGKTTQVCQK